MADEVWVLHFDGQMMTNTVLKDNGLWTGAVPKRCYTSAGRARAAISHLPEEVRRRISIVKYVPEVADNDICLWCGERYNGCME